VNRRLLPLIAALLLLLLGVTAQASAGGDDPPVASALISGVDLHDATVKKFGDTYYMYGSMYACGFQWSVHGTPWCGFGVSTSASLYGPWSAPEPLFPPNSTDPGGKRSWQATCGGTGQGCFNPRMIQRSGWGANDGTFILWFNAPRNMSDGAPNAYNVMGCNGPAGPCGPTAGAPHGSFNRPSLSKCPGNGDYGIIDAAPPAIVCSEPGNAGMDIAQLNTWGSGGSGTGVIHVAGLNHTEGPGGWWDAAHGKYVLTYSDQGCGYCAGTPIGYATSNSLYSGWSYPSNVGWGAPAYGRRIFNGASCGGQPRTVTVLDGRPWQVIDLWVGQRNETTADTLLVPLRYDPHGGSAGDGAIWEPPLELTCR
jgi:hypothetical protein